jgi:glycerophosphoryl diester phosphodiesterase
MDEPNEKWQEIAQHLGVKTININGNRNDHTREFIEQIIDEEYGVLAYTINNPMRAKELISWGVDGVFTDEPDVIRDELFAIH